MENFISAILKKTSFTKADIVTLLSASGPADAELIRASAHALLLDSCGDTVWLRGLIEFSNICINDCYYCGIRKSNEAFRRYSLSKEKIIESARFCAEAGYGSVVLQSGERRDDAFVSFVEDIVARIKQETKSPTLPRGLGITLSVGEQSEETYRRFFEAGAHRYLLRIETSSKSLFATLHPSCQSIDTRLACLDSLKRIGFQVGTGVMIGLPGQTIRDLADDVLFFKAMDIDMIGMGPYIVHRQTPMKVHEKEIEARRDEILNLALRMIAVVRIVCRDVNIASTTALQAMDPAGRELGLDHGANVVMPQATPTRVRKDYQLYEGKPCLDENAAECRQCLEARIRSLGRMPGVNGWGDSWHFKNKERRNKGLLQK